MAITGAVPRDGVVYVFGSKGEITATIPLGTGLPQRRGRG